MNYRLIPIPCLTLLLLLVAAPAPVRADPPAPAPAPAPVAAAPAAPSLLQRLRQRTDAAIARRPRSAGDALARLLPAAHARAVARYGIHYPPADADAAPLPTRLVILVHGLDEPGELWRDLIPPLRDAAIPYAEFEYPNDQAIADSTALLDRELRRLRADCGVTRVSLVAHSMGGLLCRDLLTAPDRYAGCGDPGPHSPLPVVDTLITLGTPHQGAAIAELRLAAEARDQLTRLLTGRASPIDGFFDGEGQARADLLPDSPFLTTLNARPLPSHVTLSVIAARAAPLTDADLQAIGAAVSPIPGADPATGQLRGLFDGLGDGVVSLDSSRWPGVTDYQIVEANHITMLRRTLAGHGPLPPALPLVLARLQPDLPANPPADSPKD